MKCDTSEPDYPKVDNELFNYFTTELNNLCKPMLATIQIPDRNLYGGGQRVGFNRKLT